MNYSRRQLYALGEPLGESVTRLKPGGRVYGGGGSPSNPDKTTQIAELPDWARPYAKDTLAKGAALTDIEKNPYQQYGGERIAGFQPMQQQAFAGAANMQPSQQVGLGSGIAGMAGVGALNTNYQGGQFEGGQFDNQAAQQYMNPYTQNVVDYQKSQALRDFQIAQPMRQAQAVQQGAFGGSRSAIVDAEAQRNLNSQLQGITATGQQNAFQNAQQQFNQDQARRLQAQGMGESSRQYGAGLGMQGLQTGLQAAGQLGQLGQTQYGQQMGINQLQSQYGAQQQQQAQRPLDMAYQDFQNQQNYPYKQLGFMSDMIRGLPLGQQSTQTMYQAPGSTIAQLGGLGMGALGMSSLYNSATKAADGGLMDSYAGGGDVTSQNNKENLIDDTYSIQVLMDMKSAALARRDVDTANAIDERIAQLNAIQAQSASISHGLGNAFDQIPQERQEAMMAGGGIVAFADRGAVDLEKIQRKKDREALGEAYEDFKKGARKTGAAAMDIGTLPFRAIAGAGESVITRPLRALGVDIPYLPESYYGGDASSMTPYMDKIRKEEGPAPTSATTMANRPQPKGAGARSTPAFIAKDTKEEKPVVKQKKLSPTMDKAVTEMAEKQGIPKDEFMDAFDKMRDKLQAESKEDLKGLQDLIDKQSGKSKEIKEQALGKALAEFGFNLAAQASKKGREGHGQGLAGLLGSVSAASPTLAASAAESQKLAAAADENDMKLQMEMRKFNIATRKNDSATAMQHATNMRQLQQSQETIKLQQAQLAEQQRSNIAKEGLLGRQISAKSGTSGLRGMQYVARSRAEAMKLAQKEVDSKIKGGMGLVKPEDYDRMLNQAMKRYLPITTGFGMTGMSSSKDDDDIIDLD
jgi:hypothetical protein